jgi:potassium-transporting ATPase KdpC subunit
MIKGIINEIRISLIATAGLAVLLCGIYPTLVWVVAQGLFPAQASGSLVSVNGRVIGSTLLAQRFAGPGYFHPRLSAAGEGYDAANSGGSNLGPTSRKLIAAVQERAAAYRTENSLAPGAAIPVDAVTSSASGLDPHISVPNARLQARRVARSRGLSAETIMGRVAVHTEGRTLGILGEPRVNVLMLNLDLDGKR